MSFADSVDRLLNRVPGYAGYRDLERRRDSDRAIRETLALEYGRLTGRLGTLATRLADERKIMVVQSVDKPHKRLIAFTDRVRTATYGYAPIFAENAVDEAALDQLARFDAALADARDSLEELVVELERADPASPEFKAVAVAIGDAIEALHARFDRRQELIHSGVPRPAVDVLDLLGPSDSATAPLAYRLHEREALSYLGENYTVTGRLSIESDKAGWRAFQLRGGDGDRWLVAGRDATAPLYWVRRVEPPDLDDTVVTLDGRSYQRDDELAGVGDVFGASGAARDQAVRFTRYRDPAGSGVLLVFAWQNGSVALAGEAVDESEIEFFSRER